MVPDVLDVILYDQVPRPRATTAAAAGSTIATPLRQLPSRWLLRNGSPKPEIISRVKAEERMVEQQEQQQQQERQQERQTTSPTMDKKSAPETARKSRQAEATVQARKGEQKQNRVDSKKTPRTIVNDKPSGRRRSMNDSSPSGRRSAKQIYSGRSSPLSEQRGDPPSPNSILWMDVEQFRSLLRQEAELRLRILGPDWTEVVKEESDWRLNLYKDWLWTLHNGIGSPIVPTKKATASSDYYDYKNGKSRKARQGERRARPKTRSGDEEAMTMMNSKTSRNGKPPKSRRRR